MRARTLAACLLVFPACLYAQDDDPLADPTHFDIQLVTQPPAAVGARLVVDPDGNFPTDAKSGRKVVPTNLSDLAGGPHLTDDPGWLMDAGFLTPGEELGFRALGHLRYWSPDDGAWRDEVPNGESIRVFGGIPEALAADLFGNPELRRFWLGGTIWSTSGIQGPPEALVAKTSDDGDGSVHTHIDFCIEDANGDCAARQHGDPARGAYLIEMEILSTATANGESKYRDSSPLYIVLGNALSPSELDDAVEALSADAPVDPPPPPRPPVELSNVLVPLLELLME